MMTHVLLNFGAAGGVVLILWLLMRAEFASVKGRLDRLEKSVDDLTKEHNGLAREFSELRGAIRVWMSRSDSSWFPRETRSMEKDESHQ